MPKRTSTTIARKAHARAEADFATWLMMAKLGSFDDLPPNAQTWLMSYRTRLERIPESEATAATIREIYLAYYADLGGAGDAPDLARGTSTAHATRTEDNVVDLKDIRLAKASRPTDNPTTTRPKRSWQPFLMFAGLVAALAAFKFAFGF